jgi:hypothetical protein
LETAKERQAFNINKENHLSPILALEVKKALTGNDEKEESKKSDSVKDGWSEYQEPALLQLLATELDVDIPSIVDFELSLLVFDSQKAALGGALHLTNFRQLGELFYRSSSFGGSCERRNTCQQRRYLHGHSLRSQKRLEVLLPSEPPRLSYYGRSCTSHFHRLGWNHQSGCVRVLSSQEFCLEF